MVVALGLGFTLGLSTGGAGASPRTPPRTGVSAVPGPHGSVHLVADAGGSAGPAGASERVDEQAVALAEQRFAVRLTSLLDSEGGDANVLVSPMSVAIDLAMLELGSAGATRSQIAETLQSQSLSAGAQATGWHQLVASLTGARGGTTLSLANSIWVARGLTVEPGFLDAAARSFGDDVYQTSFSSPKAVEAINSWVERATAGHIRELFVKGQLTAATELVLANAVHFHGSWAKQYALSAASVAKAPFRSAIGALERVYTMRLRGEFPAALAAGAEAVQLPYGTGRYAALFVQPTTGTLRTFLRHLSVERLATLTRSLRVQAVDLSIPELDLTARESLDEALGTLGLGPAFSSADFTPMLGAAGATNQAIGVVEHAASLRVDRYGTDAAAATGISVITSAVESGLTIHFDRPFLVLLRDTETGAVLFSCAVNNPTAG